MSTTGPSAPTIAAEESKDSTPSQLCSLRTSPTENINIRDEQKKSSSEKEEGNFSSSTEFKKNVLWDKEDCLDGGGDGLASWDDEGSLNFGNSTPPVQRWGLSLENLLDDKDGSDRFKLFLENRGAHKDSKMMVEFWYACKGLSLIEDIPGTIEAMWAKYIRNNIIKISDKTREVINNDRTKKNFHKAIFDNAKKEVEAVMSKTIYINFLRSEYCMEEIVGKDNVYYNTELHGNDILVASQLATVHEDSEYRSAHYKPSISVRPKCNRLTSKNLQASQMYRDNAGIFLQRSSNFDQEHHHAGYVSGHAISLQDSEIQSLSSGTWTDRSSSYKSGDGFLSNQRQLRKEDNHFMKHYAQLNKEDQCNITSLTTSHVPRTMRNEIRSWPSPATNQKEFSKVLIEKLERVKQEIETSEKVQQSLCKLNHSEDNADEALRQHAENSLPPSLLRNKLQEKRILDDNDPNLSDQSILDNHIKSWDPTTGSPKQYIPSREVKMRHFPHLNLPQIYNSSVPNHPKNIGKGRHYTTSSAPHSSAGTPLESHIVQFHPRNHNAHGRRRERGNDIYSNFSSDSGNVADYHDGSERFPTSNFPKSRSMSDYMENQPGNSDGGSSSRRRQVSGCRRPPRRPQADLTDSGVSDSGRSGAPSTSSKRVTNWLINCSESSDKDFSKYRGGSGARSTSHSIDVLSLTALAQKSQCSSSASNSTTALSPTTNVAHLNQEMMNMELSRDSPLGQSQTHLVHEKRKTKGNGSSSSSKSNGDGGSNGSTLRKTKVSKAPSPAPPLTVIMYHFPDESVPYVVKLRSSLVTFKLFKEHLPKKGNFRYFFKTIDQDVDCLVHLEVTDDEAEIPMYEGKVVSHMRDN